MLLMSLNIIMQGGRSPMCDENSYVTESRDKSGARYEKIWMPQIEFTTRTETHIEEFHLLLLKSKYVFHTWSYESVRISYADAGRVLHR